MAKPLRRHSGPVQLLAKHLAGLDVRRPLVALPTEPGVPRLLADRFPRLTCHYLDHAVHRRDLADDGGLDLVCEVDWGHHRGHDLGALFLPKGRPAMELAFSRLAAVLAPATPVLVVGANKSGIRSCGDLVAKYFGEAHGRRSGRHSVLLEVGRDVDPPPAFDGELAYTVGALGLEVEVRSLPGTFSYGRLDLGSELLLDHLRIGRERRVLDLGCGCGVLGTAVQLASPEARVELADSNLLAVESARRTLAVNGLRADRAVASDGFSDLRGAYDLIVCNPPFHAGLRTDLGLGQGLVAAAAGRLAPNGRLVVVANAHLAYEGVLEPRFDRLRTLARERGFKVLEAASPRPVSRR